MKILAIADRQPDNLKETLENNQFDLIITLWDLDYFDIKELEFTNTPKIWVHWNHCYRWYMEKLGIKDLHLKTFELNWLTFWWFEWCVRYKPHWEFQYHQYEANWLIKKLPKVDVLICHCPPRWINDNDDPAHYWFDGLKWYVDTFSPKILLHWHTYDYWKFVKQYKNTFVRYIEKSKIINIQQ